jgi:hypothetical protein
MRRVMAGSIDFAFRTGGTVFQNNHWAIYP